MPLKAAAQHGRPGGILIALEWRRAGALAVGPPTGAEERTRPCSSSELEGRPAAWAAAPRAGLSGATRAPRCRARSWLTCGYGQRGLSWGQVSCPSVHDGRNLYVLAQHKNSSSAPHSPSGIQQTPPAPGGPRQSTSLMWPVVEAQSPTPVHVPPTLRQAASPPNTPPLPTCPSGAGPPESPASAASPLTPPSPPRPPGAWPPESTALAASAPPESPALAASAPPSPPVATEPAVPSLSPAPDPEQPTSAQVGKTKESTNMNAARSGLRMAALDCHGWNGRGGGYVSIFALSDQCSRAPPIV